MSATKTWIIACDAAGCCARVEGASATEARCKAIGWRHGVRRRKSGPAQTFDFCAAHAMGEFAAVTLTEVIP